MTLISDCLAKNSSSCGQKELRLLQSSIVYSSQQDVNRIYRSSVSVVAHGRSCSARVLIFSVSSNLFYSLALTLLATTTVSASLLCVSPDSTALIIGQRHGFQ